jgi:GNAT superfamily N-acetyltransferase
MEPIPVTMVRDNLENLPSFELPAGYRIRAFRSGEETVWSEIEIAAGEFENLAVALNAFSANFGEDVQAMQSRSFFVETDSGLAVGTGTAWYNADFLGQDYGRVHWIGIRPEYHGRGLAKPLVRAVMRRLAESHERAYLNTFITRIPAIKVYLDFGFVPLLRTPRCEEAWKMYGEIVPHPGLSRAMSRLADG